MYPSFSLFKMLNILTLDQLITLQEQNLCTTMYVFNKLPPSFFNMWKRNRERNNLRELRNADDMYIPGHRMDLF
jgi:hypothetical protein